MESLFSYVKDVMFIKSCIILQLVAPNFTDRIIIIPGKHEEFKIKVFGNVVTEGKSRAKSMDICSQE